MGIVGIVTDGYTGDGGRVEAECCAEISSHIARLGSPCVGFGRAVLQHDHAHAIGVRAPLRVTNRLRVVPHVTQRRRRYICTSEGACQTDFAAINERQRRQRHIKKYVHARGEIIILLGGHVGLVEHAADLPAPLERGVCICCGRGYRHAETAGAIAGVDAQHCFAIVSDQRKLIDGDLRQSDDAKLLWQCLPRHECGKRRWRRVCLGTCQVGGGDCARRKNA